MAPRTFWKGYLKLSLVTCPVAMTPATGEGNRLRFHTLNRATGNRVVQQSVDAGTGKPVAGVFANGTALSNTGERLLLVL